MSTVPITVIGGAYQEHCALRQERFHLIEYKLRNNAFLEGINIESGGVFLSWEETAGNPAIPDIRHHVLFMRRTFRRMECHEPKDVCSTPAFTFAYAQTSLSNHHRLTTFNARRIMLYGYAIGPTWIFYI